MAGDSSKRIPTATAMICVIVTSIYLISNYSRAGRHNPITSRKSLIPIPINSTTSGEITRAVYETTDTTKPTRTYKNHTENIHKKTANRTNSLYSNYTPIISMKPAESGCEALLREVHAVNQSDYRIQLIAAAPGSGSDWCRVTIRLITGLRVGSVYEYLHDKTLNNLPHSAFYYKTHYPYLPGYNLVDKYLTTHSERAILLIRNPLDAGFSEYIRQQINVRKPKLGKYKDVEKIFQKSDFLAPADLNGKQRTSSGLANHLRSFIAKWKSHHEFWLTKYKEPLKVVLYRELVEDIELFRGMTDFLGYNVDLTKTRNTRFQCVLANVEKTNSLKRPRSPIIEESKEKVRIDFNRLTMDAITYVQQLYKLRYNNTVSIT